MKYEFYQTLDARVICFNTIFAECLINIIHAKDRTDSCMFSATALGCA